MLCDCLVCGISNRTVQRRLLQERALTFDKALGIALLAEAADKTGGANEDKDLPTPVDYVKDRPDPKRAGGRGNHYRKTNKPHQQSSQNSGKQQVCYRCGGHTTLLIVPSNNVSATIV